MCGPPALATQVLSMKFSVLPTEVCPDQGFFLLPIGHGLCSLPEAVPRGIEHLLSTHLLTASPKMQVLESPLSGLLLTPDVIENSRWGQHSYGSAELPSGVEVELIPSSLLWLEQRQLHHMAWGSLSKFLENQGLWREYMEADLSVEVLMLHHLVTWTRCSLTSAPVPAKLSFLSVNHAPPPSVLTVAL